MLVYLAAGERNYEKNPLKPWSRIPWEIYIVAEGRVSMETPEGRGPLCHRTLFVLPPGHIHSWRGDRGNSSQVLVFHFEVLPDPVGDWVRQRGFLQQSLTTAQLQRIQALHAEADAEWRQPGVLSSIRWSRIALDLALLIGELINPGGEAGDPQSAAGRVERAMRLFSEHLHQGWNVAEVCAAAGISAPHLRRLFQQVLGSSPQRVFEKIRLRRAQEIMMQPGGKSLEVVALGSGYQSAATLSRAFRREFSVAPTRWLGRATLRDSPSFDVWQRPARRGKGS